MKYLKAQPAPANWQATRVPSHLQYYHRGDVDDVDHCLLVPVLEVVLQDAPLTGLLAGVRVGAGHWQLVQQPFQHQVAENDNTVNIWRTRKLNLGVQVISLRGLRQMGQVAFTRK